MSDKIDSKSVFDNNTNSNNNSSRRDVSPRLQARFLGQIGQQFGTLKSFPLGLNEKFQQNKDKINVTKNDLGALTLNGATVIKNDLGALIGRLSAESNSGNQPNNYTVDDDRFEVVDGQLKLKDGVSLDYEAESEVSVTVTEFGTLVLVLNVPVLNDPVLNDNVLNDNVLNVPVLNGPVLNDNVLNGPVLNDNENTLIYPEDPLQTELASGTFTISVVDVDEEPTVLEDPSLGAAYTATVTDESGAASCATYC
jgi:hypothetical protein